MSARGGFRGGRAGATRDGPRGGSGHRHADPTQQQTPPSPASSASLLQQLRAVVPSATIGDAASGPLASGPQQPSLPPSRDVVLHDTPLPPPKATAAPPSFTVEAGAPPPTRPAQEHLQNQGHGGHPFSIGLPPGPITGLTLGQGFGVPTFTTSVGPYGGPLPQSHHLHHAPPQFQHIVRFDGRGGGVGDNGQRRGPNNNMHPAAASTAPHVAFHPPPFAVQLPLPPPSGIRLPMPAAVAVPPFGFVHPGGRGGMPLGGAPAAASGHQQRPQHSRGGGTRGAGNRGGRGAAAAERLRPHANSQRVTDEGLIHEFEQQYSAQPTAAERDPAASAAGVAMLDVPAAIAVIDQHDVTFVVTDTGTGKSSLIPIALVARGARVVSAQPRRTATVNLAARVAEVQGAPLGEKVGYRVRGEKAGADDVPLMYMTSYTLLLFLLTHPRDLMYTHFVIDEFHERQPEVEVIIALLKLAKRHVFPNIKIVLMSASVETSAWQQYFEEASFTLGEYSTCEARFPVFEYFLEKSCRLIGAADTVFPLTPVVESLALKNALFIIRRLLEFLAERTNPEHSVLVFLPGRSLVEDIGVHITQNLSDKMEAIPWYRDIELDRVHAAIKRTGGRKQKVYLATDIAEVSITIPDLVFVIDSGTTKKPRIDAAARHSVIFPALELLYESRSALSQRRGRVGRVQQGFYFSCIPTVHVPQLPDMQPLIAHARIDELSMHLLQVTPNPFSVFRLCRSAPQSASVILSESVLVDTGCALPARNALALSEAAPQPESESWTAFIDKEVAGRPVEGQQYVTTAKGFIVQRLPLSVAASLIVVNGLLFGIETEAILAAAIVSVGSPFYTFFEGSQAMQRENTQRTSDAMRFFARGEHSDLLASVVLTLRFLVMSQSGLTDADEERWCLQNCCARSRLQTVLSLTKQIRDQLAGVVSYLEMESAEATLQRVEAKPARLSWVISSAFLERAVLCVNDNADAQRQNSIGPSLFLQFQALPDRNVATVVDWAKGTIVIPAMVAERYRRVLGSFSVRLAPAEFYALMLATAFAIVAEPHPRPDGRHLMSCQLHSTTVVTSCDPEFARLILAFREGLCARMRMLALMVSRKIAINNEEALRQAAAEIDLPYLAAPEEHSARLLQGLERLCSAARENPNLVVRIPGNAVITPNYAPSVRSAIMSKRSSHSTFEMTAVAPPIVADGGKPFDAVHEEAEDDDDDDDDDGAGDGDE